MPKTSVGKGFTALTAWHSGPKYILLSAEVPFGSGIPVVGEKRIGTKAPGRARSIIPCSTATPRKVHTGLKAYCAGSSCHFRHTPCFQQPNTATPNSFRNSLGSAASSPVPLCPHGLQYLHLQLVLSPHTTLSDDVPGRTERCHHRGAAPHPAQLPKGPPKPPQPSQPNLAQPKRGTTSSKRV